MRNLNSYEAEFIRSTAKKVWDWHTYDQKCKLIGGQEQAHELIEDDPVAGNELAVRECLKFNRVQEHFGRKHALKLNAILKEVSWVYVASKVELINGRGFVEK